MSHRDPGSRHGRLGAFAVLGVSLAFGIAALVVGLNATGSRGTTLEAAGPWADVALWLHWVMFGIGGGVMALILAALLWSLVRRASNAERRQGGLMIVVVGGILLPLVVLPFLWVITLGAMADLAEPPGEPVTTVEITATQWSYEVHCPDTGETFHDELSIPVGEPVSIRVTSADVVHAFWMPQLAGKQDMLPGRWHELWVQADEPGVYLVQCAEFCGEGHTWHTMLVSVGDAGACGGVAAGGGCCG